MMSLTILENVPLFVWAVISAFCFVATLAMAYDVHRRGVASLKEAKAIAPLIKAADQLRADIEKSRKEIEALIAQRQEALIQIADGKKAKEFLEKHATEVADKEERIARLKVNLDEANNAFRAAEEGLQKKREELKELSDSYLQLQTQLEAAKMQVQNCKVAQEEMVRAAQEQKNRLDEASKRLSEDLANTQNELKDLKNTLAEAEKQKQQLDKSVAELEQKEALLKDRIKEMKESQKSLQQEKEDLEKQKDSLKTQKTTLERELSKARGEFNALETRMTEIRGVEIDADSVWSELDQPAVQDVSISREDEMDEDKDEEEWISSFDELLTDHGFIFNPRMLNAFHTGLKCGESTPLVVLSGISGTGKSLLPELYAAAAGMNFLSVPVQPRWDSPQDLLGFYNYMERRYKATELARFLWQADDWHNNDDRSFDGGALNIVLLDEMNLARIEYYFADFLSKLEQRRGADTLEQVNNASISLECGAGLTGNARRKLFVGTNTFFVGTMNEDETTQMLSDKVVDRSNMLRFGRPIQLNNTPDKKEFLDEAETWDRITQNVWDVWCANDVNLKHAYAKTVDTLNGEFATVGRPFGHRVTNAIATYLAQYPGASSRTDALKNAFADQIEMKLLPKLNGLDLATPGFDGVRNAVIKAVEETGDTVLRVAFENASDVSQQSFFRWRGVMRG